MNYYNEIKNELINNEVYGKVKDYSKNRHDLETRYNVGKLLVAAQGGSDRAKYGDGLIREYSKKLMIEVNKKYSPRTLRSMRQFYLQFDEDFWRPLVAKLNWSHFLILMRLKYL